MFGVPVEEDDVEGSLGVEDKELAAAADVLVSTEAGVNKLVTVKP